MIPFKDASQFICLFQTLSRDIVDAHIHYKLYQDLLRASEQYPLVMQQSPAFWGLTLKSHLNSALQQISRAYDQESKSLHLKSWLATIKENLSLFDTENFRERLKGNPFVDSLAKSPRRPDLQILEQDISLCSVDDSLVKLLQIHRNNSIAHISAGYAVKGMHIGETYPISFEDFEKLLARAISILNRYSQLFEASTYSTRVIGHDDYQYIFKSVDEAVERSRKLN